MDEILTIQEAAVLLKLHKRTLAKLATARKIPAKKLGAQWRFSRIALVHYVSNGMAHHPNPGESRLNEN